MGQGSRDILSGGVLLALSITMYFVIPGQVETTEGESLTPAFVPTVVTVFIGVLSALLIAQGVKTRAHEAVTDGAINLAGLKYVGAAVLVMMVYTAAIPWIGYIPATAAALLLFALLYGNRSWKQIVIVMVVAPPVILLFFRYTMLVLLPQGQLFG